MIRLILLFSFLLAISIFSLQQLHSLPTDTNIFVKVGVITIMLFSLVVITRYFILLFFSMLNLYRHINKEEHVRVPLKNKPFVTILVPCYNEEKVLKASLESLIKQTYPKFEILVIDDGSSDDTFLIAKNMEFNHGDTRLKAYTKPNGGKANALNFGIEKARGELFLSVDADSKLSPDSIDLMVEYFEDKEIAAVAGSVYVTNTDNLWTKLQALEYIQGLNLVRNGQAYFKLVNIIPGPIGMFRKSAVQDIGLYKDDTYAEDCDLTLRLIEAGYKIDYEIDAISYTEAPEDLLDLLKQRYRWTRGILQSILKHKKKLLNIYSDFSISMVLWYMLFEAIFWPIASIFANIFIIYVSLASGYGEMLLYWWIIFTILDVSASIYCVSVTKERMKLVLYSIYYRIFFINIINIAKVLASFEEFFGIEMSWGKLERKGKI
jgi:cellulose synthase/poly-beta-1,6-N-acetylglucosamine synthase-like glycosyltransferase